MIRVGSEMFDVQDLACLWSCPPPTAQIRRSRDTECGPTPAPLNTFNGPSSSLPFSSAALHTAGSVPWTVRSTSMCPSVASFISPRAPSPRSQKTEILFESGKEIRGSESAAPEQTDTANGAGRLLLPLNYERSKRMLSPVPMLMLRPR